MARELHRRKKDDKYALWSTIVDDYVTDWKSKEEIEKEWLEDLIKDAKVKVKSYMQRIDKEV
ncbi:MAG: hypothetical protein HFJ35_02660 [Clostridia bacterium]|nr:hypothetical protein [Clostridia bacterium]